MIADYHMPGIDGVALARQLRALPGRRAYVLLTSVGHWKEHAAGRVIHACLTKPVRHRKLRDTLAAAWLRHHPGADAFGIAPPAERTLRDRLSAADARVPGIPRR